MIDVLPDEGVVHAAQWLLTRRRAPSAAPWSVAVLSNNVEGRDVHTVTADSQDEGVSVAVASIRHHRIPPKKVRNLKDEVEWQNR